MKMLSTAAAVLAALTLGSWAENEGTPTPVGGTDTKPAGAQRGKEGIRGERTHPMMQEILKKYDTDGDGKLSEEERAAARAANEKENEARMVERFNAMDKDGNGSISKEEWLASLKDRGPMMGHGRGRSEWKKTEGGADTAAGAAKAEGAKAENAAEPTTEKK